MSKGSGVRLNDDSRMEVLHDTKVLFCERRLPSRQRTVSRKAAKWQAWPFGLSFLLMLTTLGCEQSAKSAEAEQAAPAPVEAPAPSAPEPAPEPFSPEKRLGAGKISDWRVADKDVRIRAANEFNLIFERTSPPDHELSRVERAVKAIALDRCLMETTKEPAMQEQSVASTAALCLVMMDAR